MSFKFCKRLAAVGACFMTLVAASPSLLAEHVVVYPSTDEAPFSFDLKELAHISFEGKNVVFTSLTGATRSMAMCEVSELRFSNEAYSGVESLATDGVALSVYPNPTADILYLCLPDGIEPAAASVAIYSVNGKQMWAADGLATSSLDVSRLAQGVYILTVNNHSIQFIKK